MLCDSERVERIGQDAYSRENTDSCPIRPGSRKKHPFKARSDRDRMRPRVIGRVVSGGGHEKNWCCKRKKRRDF